MLPNWKNSTVQINNTHFISLYNPESHIHDDSQISLSQVVDATYYQNLLNLIDAKIRETEGGNLEKDSILEPVLTLNPNAILFNHSSKNRIISLPSISSDEVAKLNSEVHYEDVVEADVDLIEMLYRENNETPMKSSYKNYEEFSDLSTNESAKVNGRDYSEMNSLRKKVKFSETNQEFTYSHKVDDGNPLPLPVPDDMIPDMNGLKPEAPDEYNVINPDYVNLTRTINKIPNANPTSRKDKEFINYVLNRALEPPRNVVCTPPKNGSNLSNIPDNRPKSNIIVNGTSQRVENAKSNGKKVVDSPKSPSSKNGVSYRFPDEIRGDLLKLESPTDLAEKFFNYLGLQIRVYTDSKGKSQISKIEIDGQTVAQTIADTKQKARMKAAIEAIYKFDNEFMTEWIELHSNTKRKYLNS